MIQKVIIPLDTSKHKPERDHVLLYDEKKRAYFAVSRESLLSEQNNKIQLLKEEVAILKKQNELFMADMLNKFNNFKEHYQDFLKTYQETNNELIGMVKSLLEEK